MHQGKDTVVAAEPDFTVEEFSCLDDHTGWFGMYQNEYQIMLVRKGMFRVRYGGVVSDVDKTTCYLGVPGVARQFAHPAGYADDDGVVRDLTTYDGVGREHAATTDISAAKHCCMLTW